MKYLIYFAFMFIGATIGSAFEYYLKYNIYQTVILGLINAIHRNK